METWMITIEADGNECGRNCAFLEDDTCLLFSCELEETKLERNEVWGDGVSPTRQRNYRCLMSGESNLSKG